MINSYENLQKLAVISRIFECEKWTWYDDGAYKITVITKDIYAKETIDYLSSIVGQEPVLFICDGVDKSIEMNTWIPLLPINSIICGHDYRTECKPEKIEDVVKKHCEPFDAENWEKLNVQFCMYKKVK